MYSDGTKSSSRLWAWGKETDKMNSTDSSAPSLKMFLGPTVHVMEYSVHHVLFADEPRFVFYLDTLYVDTCEDDPEL